MREFKHRQVVYFKVKNMYFKGKYHRDSYKNGIIEVLMGDDVSGRIVDVSTDYLITLEEYEKKK